MAELNTVMGNVMAALNTFGLSFDTNCEGFHVKKEKLENSEKVVEFHPYGDNSKFEKAFDEFLNNHHYYAGMAGKYWMEAGEYVVIQLRRMYEKTVEEYEYEQNIEEELYYEDLLLNVKIQKGEISSFVRAVAPHCW